MRLKYQILLTLLAFSIVLIAIMFAISSWSFSRGFSEYVNQQLIQRYIPTADAMVAHYEANSGWDSITPAEIARIELGPGGLNGRTRIPARIPANMAANMAAKMAANKAANKAERGKRPESRRGNRPSTRPDRQRDGPPAMLATALVLADKNKNTLLGRVPKTRDFVWMELVSKDELVGYLGLRKSAGVSEQYDTVFKEKQNKSFMWAAIAMFALSILLSYKLGSFIVSPLLKVNSAVDEISSGNYKHRLETNRRDELGDLSNNINTLGLSLEKNQEARQRWIAEISHELRTPVAILRGELEAVQDGVRKLDRPVIDSLHVETLSLGRLIDDLHTLSLSDVGALDYKMQLIDLTKVVEGFMASGSVLLAEQNLKLTLKTDSAPLPLQGDRQRLDQLLGNLLQNTCRYTDSGGELEVRLTSSAAKGKTECVLEWLDSSPGVDAELLPKLFDPLFRIDDSRNRELGGSGLGLAIASRIVEAHHGSIAASESKLGGLHLTIRLPAST